MTDKLRNVVWNVEFDPFGNDISQSGRGGSYIRNVTNNLRFPGQYFDAETGLNYNYFKDYNPMIGRYIEADPVGIKNGRNHLYIYALNNTISLFDEMGLDANTWTYGEIRAWAIYSSTDFSSPAGLADAKASIAAVCGRGNPCNSVDGTYATTPEDRAAWNNIVNATGGEDQSNGGSLMCVGTENCWFVHRCYKCCGGKKTLIDRGNNLQSCGTTIVLSTRGGTLYFYNDPLQGWCSVSDYNSGCQ
jgi:RHS repeat-associated protein